MTAQLDRTAPAAAGRPGGGPAHPGPCPRRRRGAARGRRRGRRPVPRRRARASTAATSASTSSSSCPASSSPACCWPRCAAAARCRCGGSGPGGHDGCCPWRPWSPSPRWRPRGSCSPPLEVARDRPGRGVERAVRHEPAARARRGRLPRRRRRVARTSTTGPSGVEEQFYLLWPVAVVLVVLGARWAARRRSAVADRALRAARTSGGPDVAGPCSSSPRSPSPRPSRGACGAPPSSQPLAYFEPWSRGWELGCRALCWPWPRPPWPACPDRSATSPAVLGLVSRRRVGAAAGRGHPVPRHRRPVPVLGTMAVVAAGTGGSTRLGRLLGAAPLRAARPALLRLVPVALAGAAAGPARPGRRPRPGGPPAAVVCAPWGWRG